MGTRFCFGNYMTGESPGTPTETGARNADANQMPDAWEMLFADLERRRPALFVDAAAAGWDGYDKFPIARYPRLRAYVDAHYGRSTCAPASSCIGGCGRGRPRSPPPPRARRGRGGR